MNEAICHTRASLRCAFYIFSIFPLFLTLYGTICAQEQSRSRSITGRVVGENGQPLAYVSVHVRNLSLNNAGRTTGTSESGEFAVPDLEPGVYTIAASAPGYITSREEASTYRRPGDSVTLKLRKGGAITGKVTNSTGEPVIGVPVRILRLRDEENRPSEVFYGFGRGERTDDRGIYRIYGLPSGAYHVLAGGGSNSQFYGHGSSPYEMDAPTYHPSATRDTAAEVTVRESSETLGIDIQYRGEPGRTVSGAISGAIESGSSEPGGVNVTLANAISGAIEAATYANGRERGFAFNGVPDGEYELTARRYSPNLTDTGAASPPQSVVVKGSNITGIELVLAPLSTLSGMVRVETSAPTSKESCANNRGATVLPVEVVVSARGEEKKEGAKNIPRPPANSVPTQTGEFTLRNLDAGRYAVEVQLPGESHYVRMITMPAARPPARANQKAMRQSTDVVTNEFTITSGTQLDKMLITIAPGAARLQGSVLPVAEGAPLPRRLRIYLVPSEAEYADYAWRYRSMLAEADGRWTLANIAPGTYKLLAVSADAEMLERRPQPLTASVAGRAQLRREAEAKGTTIQLAQCAAHADFNVRYTPASSSSSR